MKKVITLHLFAFGCDRIELVDEDDRGRVLFCFFERLPQIALALTGHLAHNFGTIDQEEEDASLVGHGTGHKSFACTGWAKHEDTARRLNTDGLEELSTDGLK